MFKYGVFSTHTGNLKYIFELFFFSFSRQANIFSNIPVDLDQCRGLLY